MISAGTRRVDAAPVRRHRRRVAVGALGVVVLVTGCSRSEMIRAGSPAPTGLPSSSAASAADAGVPSSRAAAGRPKPPPGVFAQVTAGSAVLASAVQVGAAGAGQGPLTVVTFSPTRARLVLHPGSVEPATVSGWRYGPTIGRAERRVLIAAFNGGFKMHDARGGWTSEGRTIRPLVHGGASVVIYRDGGVDIGAWGTEVPQPGRRIASVRQNLQLLVDHGRAQLTHPNSQAQLDAWWGHAFRRKPLIARSALGVTATGALVWAAGNRTTVAALARALIGAHVVRALELDINAPLVRGFLYSSPGLALASQSLSGAVVPLVVGQRQLHHDPALLDSAIAPHCTYLTACSRDFFTVLLH